MAAFLLKRNGEKLQVILEGDLIASIITNLQQALKEAVEQGIQEITFDLTNTGMLDSSGIGLLIITNNTLNKSKGNMSVVNVAPEIMQLLQNMRLIKRLNVSGRNNQEVTNG